MGLLPRLFVFVFLVTMFTAIYLLFFSDSEKHWNGLNDSNDKHFEQKVLNRLYFVCTTFSTAGYGDITPKSTALKWVVVFKQMLMLLQISESAIEAMSERSRNKATVVNVNPKPPNSRIILR
jgi:hypothetical protein